MSNAAFGIDNCIDLYEKLKHDYASLDSVNMDPYCLLNYLTTAKHIVEWILNDHNIDKSIRDEIGGIGKLERTNSDFYIINSLCNHSKHFVLNDKNKELKKNEKKYIIDFNNVNFNNLFEEKCEYYVDHNGSSVKVYDVCTRYYNFIDSFIGKHKEAFKSLNYL